MRYTPTWFDCVLQDSLLVSVPDNDCFLSRICYNRINSNIFFTSGHKENDHVTEAWETADPVGQK